MSDEDFSNLLDLLDVGSEAQYRFITRRILHDYQQVQNDVEDPNNSRGRLIDLDADVNHIFDLMKARQSILDEKDAREAKATEINLQDETLIHELEDTKEE